MNLYRWYERNQIIVPNVWVAHWEISWNQSILILKNLEFRLIRSDQTGQEVNFERHSKRFFFVFQRIKNNEKWQEDMRNSVSEIGWAQGQF